MIPKIIHYCWFGGNKKSKIILECIESWKKYCPDYEIIEWNEQNFDVNKVVYVRNAYNAKKWAFVSDYVRLWCVYNYGGVYLDTDVLLSYNSLDKLCNNSCWLASENVRTVSTGLGFGAEKQNKIIGKMMASYHELQFPTTVNSVIDTQTLEKVLCNWIKSDVTQLVDGVLIIGCRDYGKYAKHLATLSWLLSEEEQQARLNNIQDEPSKIGILKWRIVSTLSRPCIIHYMDKHKGSVVEKIYTFFVYDLIPVGFSYYIKRVINKIIKK